VTAATQSKEKVKLSIPVTGRGCLEGLEMFRIPHCLDSHLTDGGKVASLNAPAAFFSPEILFIVLLLVLIYVRG
jgi:hypothetical protein